MKSLLCGHWLASLQVKGQHRLHNASDIHLQRLDEAPSRCSLENQCLPLRQAASLSQRHCEPSCTENRPPPPDLNHYSLVNRRNTLVSRLWDPREVHV